ncbi:uncharacterized protein CEXT_431691 [Caerostris extrusa]|uniref:Uncharacterized protein n=1 Tax=Caerostris extrusa TaxID=172846 RepID=A0AAV4R1C7_CAEEX|nr:uncharacterized protein CEXT_431691 [Caerostris extrusa]
MTTYSLSMILKTKPSTHTVPMTLPSRTSLDDDPPVAPNHAPLPPISEENWRAYYQPSLVVLNGGSEEGVSAIYETTTAYKLPPLAKFGKGLVGKVPTIWSVLSDCELPTLLKLSKSIMPFTTNNAMVPPSPKPSIKSRHLIHLAFTTDPLFHHDQVYWSGVQNSTCIRMMIFARLGDPELTNEAPFPSVFQQQ